MDDCPDCELKDRKIKRLQAQHTAFKQKVRERAVAEADRRGWCGEFDEIIKEFGLAGRWNEYIAEFKLNEGLPDSLKRQYEPTYTGRCLARSLDHARDLLTNDTTRRNGAVYTLVKVTRAHENGELIE